MSTAQEQMGFRDLTFSGWVRENLPDSHTGFWVSDIDFFLFNRHSKTTMLVEVKTNGKKLRHWQQTMFDHLNDVLKEGYASERFSDWQYLGLNTITFQYDDFTVGGCLYNGQLVTEADLVDILSF